MRPVAEMEVRCGMRRGHTQQDLTGIEANSRELVAHTVGGVQCNVQSNPYSFIFRYKVVRPMPKSRAAFDRSPLVAANAWPMACFSLSGSEITGERGEIDTSGRSRLHWIASERLSSP